MKSIVYDQARKIETAPFAALVGEEIISFIFEHAPLKVQTRIARALDHYIRSARLKDIDEEMGAIRLIAGEEELVVAIFEWLKLNADHFPEHRAFVRKFKNHGVKLAFYPVLRQFRFVLSDMLEDGFTLDGLEDLISWTAKPVVEDKKILLALCKEDGEEITRVDPFSIDLSQGEHRGQSTVPLLLADLTKTIRNQLGMTLREFLGARTEFRNHMLYATDGGAASLGNNYDDLTRQFSETYHDLLWVLALLIGGKPPSKTWGIVSQFIGVYRLALIEAKILKADNSLVGPSD